jgi:hypothetical protein
MEDRCIDRLTELLNGHDGDLDNGAELVITEPDGTVSMRAPLARHYRLDDEDPHVLWLRPVPGGTQAPGAAGLPVFNLSLCRRRGLAFTAATIDQDGNVILALRGGQTATIQPATGRQLATLHLWDDFTLNILTAEEELDLDRLATDSWHGRFG